MIPDSYKENQRCSNCEYSLRKGWGFTYCGHDGSSMPEPMTKEWDDAHYVDSDGDCDEWEGR